MAENFLADFNRQTEIYELEVKLIIRKASEDIDAFPQTGMVIAGEVVQTDGIVLDQDHGLKTSVVATPEGMFRVPLVQKMSGNLLGLWPDFDNKQKAPAATLANFTPELLIKLAALHQERQPQTAHGTALSAAEISLFLQGQRPIL